MLPLGEMLGPFGPCVATRQGAPSSQADLMSALSFSLTDMRRVFLRQICVSGRRHRIGSSEALDRGKLASQLNMKCRPLREADIARRNYEWTLRPRAWRPWPAAAPARPGGGRRGLGYFAWEGGD